MAMDDDPNTRPVGAREPVPEALDTLARKVVDSAFKVHRTLGPGLLESVYETCLCQELSVRNVRFVRQKPVSIFYEGVVIDHGLRIDLLVDDQLVVELKAVERILPLHEAQLITYLRLSRLRLGLLINFNVHSFKQGIRRLVL